jgi:hypothetical protein
LLTFKYSNNLLIDKLYEFNYFLRHYKPTIIKDVFTFNFKTKNLFDYFHSTEQIKLKGAKGKEISTTRGDLRQTTFRQYPFLFDLISDGYMKNQQITIPTEMLERAIDSGNLITDEVASSFGISKATLHKVLKRIPLSENVGMRSNLIIQILTKCKINIDVLPQEPEGFYFDLTPSEKKIALLNQQQAFCDVLCGCVRLAEDLGFKFDRSNPGSYPKFLVELIRTTIGTKKSDWQERAQALPLELKKMTLQRSIIKDAIDDYIKTVALAHHIRQNPEFNLNTDLESFRLKAVRKLLKNVPIETIVAFSNEWHKPGRTAQLNKAKTFSDSSWEPIFPNPIMYADGPNRPITAVPLITTDDLKEEGDKLTHCVGGYTSDCLIGNSHIISLRDEQGTPLSTIELHLLEGTGPSGNPKIINIKNESRFHLKLNQHYGRNNENPAADCIGIENRLFDEIRQGKIKIDLPSLEAKRIERVAILNSSDKKNIVLAGYDPLNDEEFEAAKEIYRTQLSMMALKSRSFITNFDKLSGLTKKSTTVKNRVPGNSSDTSYFV